MTNDLFLARADGTKSWKCNVVLGMMSVFLVASEQQTLLPELMHNVQMLVDTAETEILRSDRR